MIQLILYLIFYLLISFIIVIVMASLECLHLIISRKRWDGVDLIFYAFGGVRMEGGGLVEVGLRDLMAGFLVIGFLLEILLILFLLFDWLSLHYRHLTTNSLLTFVSNLIFLSLNFIPL